MQSQLDRLSFQPDIYSPNWTLIDAMDVKFLQDAGIRVIPWTVNSQEDLYAVMQLGVDGIITDFPTASTQCAEPRDQRRTWTNPFRRMISGMRSLRSSMTISHM